MTSTMGFTVFGHIQVQVSHSGTTAVTKGSIYKRHGQEKYIAVTVCPVCPSAEELAVFTSSELSTVDEAFNELQVLMMHRASELGSN